MNEYSLAKVQLNIIKLFECFFLLQEKSLPSLT